MGQQVAHPVDAASLQGGVEDLRCVRPRSLVVVGDDELDAAQAAIGERTQEALPEQLGLRRAGGDAEDVAPAIGVHTDSDYRRCGHDTARLERFDIGFIDPQIRPFALDRAGVKGIHLLVDLCNQSADLAF